MSKSIKSKSSEMAKSGIMFQFDTIFDEATKKQMYDLGIQEFLDQMIEMRASDLDTINFHTPRILQSTGSVYDTQFMTDNKE